MTLKIKILFIIISLSILGLTVSGYYSFTSYRDDKLAYVYDSLTEKTEASSKLFSAVAEDYEMLLNMLISFSDFNDENSLASIRNLLDGDQRKISGVYLHLPEKNEFTLFQSKKLVAPVEWQVLRGASHGISLAAEKTQLFYLKRPIGKDGYAVLAFEHPGLWDLISSEGESVRFFVNQKNFIAQKKLPFNEKEIMALFPRAVSLPAANGLFEEKLGGETHLVAYSQIGSRNLILMNAVPSKKLLLIQDIILRQIVSFLILTASIALLIGTFAARWLTKQLEAITEAVQEIENENLDVIVPVKSKDELGRLGNAFNSMTARIRGLLEELRLYNLELEEKVRERTQELQSLTDIQKGMLNALGQGFVILDRNHEILPVYSRVSEEMFEVVPSDAAPGDILGLSSTDADSFRELFGMAFEGGLSFEDVFRLAPVKRTNTKRAVIQLNYAEIKNSETDSPDYVLIVGTDKTTEIENEERAQKEIAYSRMLQKIATNRFAAARVLSDALRMLDEAELTLANEVPGEVLRVQRLIHTIKGGLAYFHITDIAAVCHELESSLEPHLGKENCTDDVRLDVLQKCLGIRSAIEKYIREFDDIIRFHDARTMKNIPITQLLSFRDLLSNELPLLAAEFEERFFSVPVAPFFEMYPGIASELGSKLGKNLRFELQGGDLTLPEGPWEEIFNQFVHFIRNSADHGIETPEERILANKASHGTIKFQFSRQASRLVIELSDDGRGVNWKKMSEKDPTIDSLEEAINRIIQGGLSSADKVSDVSGRGVGVSALYQAVVSRNGICQFSSQEGHGFLVRIEFDLNNAFSELSLVA
jgi:two-component system chemotaxis sensor kinase CheA